MYRVFSGLLVLLAAGFHFSICYADAIEADFQASLDGTAHWSAPAVTELNGNIPDGQEIITATQRGAVEVFNVQKGSLWKSFVPGAPCGGGAAYVQSSPAVDDLDGDGVKEVVIGYGPIGVTSCKGGVVAFDGLTGAVKWVFEITRESTRENFHSVISTPAIADADGDGFKEVAFGGLDRNVYILNSAGKKVFKYTAGDTVFSSADFANVNGRGALEMVLGTDISRNDVVGTPNGGIMYAFTPDYGSSAGAGKKKCRQFKSKKRRRRCRRKQRKKKKNRRQFSTAQQVEFGFQEDSAFLWHRELDQVSQSAPVVAEVLSRSAGPEVVVGTGCFFPQNSSAKRGKEVRVLSASKGAQIATLSLNSCIASSPTVADLNGDGLLDILITTSGSRDKGGENIPLLVAWTPETDTILWQKTPRVKGRTDSLLGEHARQTVVVDFDGNGSLEVVLAMSSGLQIFSGSTGEALLCEESDCGLLDTLQVTGSLYGTPAIGDTNGDGRPDLVVTRGTLRVWQNIDAVITSEAGPHPAFDAPWPMWRKTPARSPSLQ